MKADAAAPRYLTASPRSRAADAREEGLALVARANRWVVSGAVLLAGGVTAIAAHSFHAHTASAPATSASPSSVAPGQAAPGQGGGLQGPSQAPQSAPAPAVSAPAPVVSGGS
ncbi:MAG: hypothetical protein ABSH51_07720 [Solirubrobacteraceae bacterium]